MRSTAVCALVCALSGALAFAPPRQPSPRSRGGDDAAPPLGSTMESPVESPAGASPPASASSSSSPPRLAADFVMTEKNRPTWDVKQHRYGLDMVRAAGEDAPGGAVASVTIGADGEEEGGEGLPLPKTYITCGKCKALFAIAAEDLGDRGKGCRVLCSTCGSSWYQSRDRLFDIPSDTHDMVPADPSDLSRIARNLARDVSPNFQGVGKLYVGNLDWRTTPDELLDFFTTYARKEGEDKPVDVCDVSIVTGPDGRSRGFAFVTFYDESDGRAALACNGLECNGRELAVREPNN